MVKPFKQTQRIYARLYTSSRWRWRYRPQAHNTIASLVLLYGWSTTLYIHIYCFTEAYIIYFVFVMVETEFLADRRISLFILFCYYLFGTLKTRRRHEQQEESDVKDTGDCGTCMCLYFTHTVLNTTILTYVGGRGECTCVESIGVSSISRIIRKTVEFFFCCL